LISTTVMIIMNLNHIIEHRVKFNENNFFLLNFTLNLHWQGSFWQNMDYLTFNDSKDGFLVIFVVKRIEY